MKVELGSSFIEVDLFFKVEDKLKNCYVNLINILFKKESGIKFSVSAYKFFNGNFSGKDKDDESIISVFEIEL